MFNLFSLFKSSPTLAISGSPVVSSWEWFNATDPSIIKRDKWYMYFTAMNQKNELHILEATATSISGKWTINPKPVISPLWAISVETASYVKGSKERIYFTGWKDTTNYNIGFSEFDGTKWIQHPEPIIQPEPWEISKYGTILGDQTVVYKDKWFMFYQVGTDNGTILVSTESEDGIHWSPRKPTLLPTPSPTPSMPSGPYHMDAQIIEGTWYFTGWFPHVNLAKQGIYTVKVNKNGSTLIPLLMEGKGPTWFQPTNQTFQKEHKNGLFGSCLIKDGATFWLYFHTVTTPSTDVGNIGYIKVKI